MLSQYPQIEVLESRENVGFCVANNRMVEHARGKYVLLLNNDATLFPDALKTLADYAENNEETGILTLPQYDWESGELVDRGCLLDPFYNPVPNLDPERTEVAMVIGACLWIRRETWQDLGGFPEWFEAVGEDLYICCLARLRGEFVRTTKESGYRHRQGHRIGGNKPEMGRLCTTYNRRALSERNKTFTLLILTPTLFMPLLAMLHFSMLTLEGLILAVASRNLRVLNKVYWAALSSTLLQSKRIVAEREKAQGARDCSVKEYRRPFTLVPRKLWLLCQYGIPVIR
tara:strand:- start:6675 stop:7535 length:861 start_codon:yes stop_codon:yes gene_type:complete